MAEQEEQYDNSNKRVIGRPFQPGESGNPNGRPKGSNYKARFKRLLEKYTSYEAPPKIIASLKANLKNIPEDITIEEAEAFRVHLAALAGESWAFDRLHDKPCSGELDSSQQQKVGVSVEVTDKALTNMSEEDLDKLSDAILTIKRRCDASTDQK